jgi:hypothetical protein
MMDIVDVLGVVEREFWVEAFAVVEIVEGGCSG